MPARIASISARPGIKSNSERIDSRQRGNNTSHRIGNVPCSQRGGWDVPVDCDGLRKVEAFVIEEEIGLPTENLLRDDGTANRSAVTAVVETGTGDAVIIILPALGRPVVIFVVFVARAVPGLGSAFGDDLHFGAGRTIEIGGLAGGIHFEFFDAILRSGDYARGAANPYSQVILRGHATGRIARIAGGVDVHAAVHVVGIVAAIEREVVLVKNGAADAAVRTYARLQFDECADVAAQAGQVIDGDAVNGVAHRGVHRLQLIADGGHFYHHIRCAHLQNQIRRKVDSDLHDLILSLRGGKSTLSDSETVSARGNVGKEVAPGPVRVRGTRDIGRGIRQRNRCACHHRIRRVSD